MYRDHKICRWRTSYALSHRVQLWVKDKRSCSNLSLNMPRRTSNHIKYSWMDVAFPYFLNAFVHNRYNLHHAPFFAFLLRDYLSMNSCHNHSCSAYSMPCIVRWTPRVLSPLLEGTINPMSWFLCVCQFWFNFGTDPMRPRKLSGRVRCKHRYRLLEEYQSIYFT